MKNSFIRLLFLGAIFTIVSLGSCRKEVIYPTNQLPACVPKSSNFDGIGRWGKFVVIDAVMYVEDHETGEKRVYNHFSATKSKSSLRWDGSIFEIEDIEKNKTSYSFWAPVSVPGLGKFVLNDDTTKFYAVQYTGSYSSIIDEPTHGQRNLGGSTRPYSGQTISKVDKTIAIEIQEMEGSINGHNCRYWTQLTLKKIQEW